MDNFVLGILQAGKILKIAEDTIFVSFLSGRKVPEMQDSTKVLHFL